MTAMQIATGILDKLQEENRICLDTLHQAQDKNKYYERQLAEKDRLIKMLEEQIRTGTNGILEMTNRQKELTIKHLELQVQKLLKENEDFAVQLEAIKAEICAKCETKLLLKENRENRSASKLYNPPGKASSGLFEKKTLSICPNRIKALERIIEHKDKRIMHLSKEVQRLSKTEKELTQKVYRLTKLLPMSRLPPEAVTECLLKEIQALESQKESCTNSCDRLQRVNDLYKLKKNASTSCATTSKVNLSKSSDRQLKFSTSNLKPSTVSLTESQQDVPDVNKVENEILYKKLQKLYNDINELKRLFAFESEKLSEGLQSTAGEYNSFKIHLEEIIDNLNEVIKKILSNSFNFTHENICDTAESTDDKYVIACLQERLKDSLGMVTEYENENKALKEKLDQLSIQSAQLDTSPLGPRKSSDKLYKSFSDSAQLQSINDVKKLKEIIKSKETQIEAAQSHINTCQKFIEELQKHVTFESSKLQCACASGSEKKSNNFHEHENKLLKTKLDVAEKNIKTCENVIEKLQSTIRSLEEDNERLESELHAAKSKALSETDYHNVNLQSKLTSYSDTCIITLKNLNQELNDKVKTLEDANSKLTTSIKSSDSRTTSLEICEQEKKVLKSKLDASEKHICTLQKGVETLQEKLTELETEKNNLEIELKDIRMKNQLTEIYETDVLALKNELILKEDENKELKQSLHTLENKTLEMNHYRKSLHQEIEKLCNALMENEEIEDNSRRKSIYKAAVLRSAQALLRLDDNYNFKPDDSDRNSALEEMKHQIKVYLTEVARIHELVTIKEHERDELLKEYLDLPDDAILRPSSSLHHVLHMQEKGTDGNLQSSADLLTSDGLKSDSPSSKKTESVKTSYEKCIKSSAELEAELKILQEELNSTKSVTSYLLSSCTRLEDMLSRERTERVKCERELEVYQENIKDLKSQLSIKNNMTKRLNSLIEMMRSKECNDEITLEQLKSEIKWLVEENQKIFERVTSTQTELCQCREENSRIQNDLDTMKRQLLNEKYENAKVNNELKHLRFQISNSQLTLNESNPN